MRQTSHQLREQDQSSFARYSNQMADKVERASDYLENRNLDELLREGEQFARRQPELFIGGAFALGLLMARFIKSSASRRAEEEAERPLPRPTMAATPPGRYPQGSSSNPPQRF